MHKTFSRFSGNHWILFWIEKATFHGISMDLVIFMIFDSPMLAIQKCLVVIFRLFYIEHILQHPHPIFTVWRFYPGIWNDLDLIQGLQMLRRAPRSIPVTIHDVSSVLFLQLDTATLPGTARPTLPDSEKYLWHGLWRHLWHPDKIYTINSKHSCPRLSNTVFGSRIGPVIW